MAKPATAIDANSRRLNSIGFVDPSFRGSFTVGS
jgi:hypothetical protein